MTAQIPPETSNAYFLLGYAIVFVILIGLMGYFALRARRLRSEVKALESIELEG